jgi:hypothetical protein
LHTDAIQRSSCILFTDYVQPESTSIFCHYRLIKRKRVW